MVVVGGEVVVGQVLCWVAGAPEVVHHLDVKVVIACYAEGVFGGTDTLISWLVASGDSRGEGK